MAFIKPYTYVDGTILSADDQASNDDAVKDYLNSGIAAGDYAGEFIDFDQIEVGELEPITGAYRFMSGEIWGTAVGTAAPERSYFTSNIRNGKQTAVNPSIYQTVYETGQTVELIHEGDLLITFGGTFKCEENEVQANGRWDSTVVLRYKESPTAKWENVPGTEAFTFEETYSAGTAPRAVTDLNPFPIIAYPASERPETMFRRFIGFTWLIKGLSPGIYTFSVATKSKAEEGFASARSFTIEIFYA